LLSLPQLLVRFFETLDDAGSLFNCNLSLLNTVVLAFQLSPQIHIQSDKVRIGVPKRPGFILKSRCLLADHLDGLLKLPIPFS
jgi:hypothetical protein